MGAREKDGERRVGLGRKSDRKVDKSKYRSGGEVDGKRKRKYVGLTPS